MSEYDANGFSVEVADELTPSGAKSRAKKSELQIQAEQFAAEFHYEWPVNDAALREISATRMRQLAIRGAIEYARTVIGSNARKYLEESSIPLSSLAKSIGVSPNALHHSCYDEKFTMPVDALIKLCYKHMHISVNEFLFGRARPTMLPRYLQPIARTLYEYQENEDDGIYHLHAMHTLGRNIFLSKAGLEWPISIEAHCEEPFDKVFRERILELAGDSYKHIENLPMEVLEKSVVRRIFEQDAPLARGMMNSLMRTAISCDVSIDYLIARDYTLFGTVACLDKNGQVCVLHDRRALEIIGMLLSMPADARNEYYTKFLYRVRFEGHK